MFATYLGRELGNRKKQTIIVAIGLALAVALVMIVSSIAAGVRDAQAKALEAVYGVGTDITITQAAAAPEEGQGPGGLQFQFGAEDGTSDGTTRELNQTTLSASFTTPTFDATAVATAAETDGVAAAAGSLTLQNTTFSGEIADFQQFRGTDGGMGGFGEGGTPPQIPEGGFDGAGGSGFGVDSFTVVGVDTDQLAVGPLTATTVSDGRSLDADDAAAHVAVLDADYATTNELAVGDLITVGEATDVEVVGIAASTSTSGTSAGDVYLPLGTAQELAGLEDVVSTVYVQATSSDAIGSVQTALEAELPDYTVNTQAELASTVSGSLTATASLISNLGLWLSIAVLAAAFLIAILFTVSGVARRTREFGTLKATGWSDARIVGQVAGESFVTGLIGAAVGVAIGLAGVWVIDLISPTISVGGTASGEIASRTFQGGPGGGMGGFSGTGGFGGGPGGATAAAAQDIVLTAPLTWSVVLIAVGLAVLGGIIAGIIGGWRAARLKPAEALRQVA